MSAPTFDLDAAAVLAQQILDGVLAMTDKQIAYAYRLASVAGVLPEKKLLTLCQTHRFGEFCQIVSEAIIHTREGAIP